MPSFQTGIDLVRGFVEEHPQRGAIVSRHLLIKGLIPIEKESILVEMVVGCELLYAAWRLPKIAVTVLSNSNRGSNKSSS